MPVVVVVVVVRALVRRDTGAGARPGEGHGVRHFFQYLLLLGLLVVTLIGLSTLAGLAVRPGPMVDTGDALARA